MAGPRGGRKSKAEKAAATEQPAVDHVDSAPISDEAVASESENLPTPVEETPDQAAQSKQYRALTKIMHGALSGERFVFEKGGPVAGLSDAEISGLLARGLIEEIQG